MFTGLSVVFAKCFTIFLEIRVRFFLPSLCKYFGSPSVCQLWVMERTQSLLYSDKQTVTQIINDSI